MEELTEEPVELVARVCAVDIGKAGLVVCVRVPRDQARPAGAGGARVRRGDAGVAGAGGLAALPTGGAGGDGGHLRLPAA